MPGGWASAGQRSGAGRWKERGQGAHARVSTSWPRLRAAAVVALGDRSDRTSHPVRSLCRARRDLVPEHALLASLALPAFRFCIWDLALDTEPVTQFGRFAAHAATWFPSTLCSPASPTRLPLCIWDLALDTEPVTQFRRFASTPRPGSRARSARHLALPAFRFCTWNLVHITSGRRVPALCLARRTSLHVRKRRRSVRSRPRRWSIRVGQLSALPLDPTVSASCSRRPRLMLDLLSSFLSDVRLEVQAPRHHLLRGQWALLVPEGPPSLHLLRRGHCRASSAESRHALPIGTGWALLLSGARESTIRAYGPDGPTTSEFDWDGGTPLEEGVSLPADPSAALLSPHESRWWVGLGFRFLSPPSLRSIRSGCGRAGGENPSSRPSTASSFIRGSASPRLSSASSRSSSSRGSGARYVPGFWKAPGWLGVLTDPVLRTGLLDAGSDSALASVGALSAEVHRSPRTVRARVRGFSGAPPGHLLRQLRLERALRQLEEGEPTLDALARELGYANASSFCRAFRREVGCSPAEYWRRTRNRPFPRRARHPSSGEASDDRETTTLDSTPRDE